MSSTQEIFTVNPTTGEFNWTIEPMASPPPPKDSVDHPPHYTAHSSGIECIEITEHMNFCLGNAVKYIWRADLKGGTEDLRKARWYIEREIARRIRADAVDKQSG